jgi:RNA polymerase sigma factor for flagellar operon FliA
MSMHRALATYTAARQDADSLIQKYASLIDRLARRLVSRIGHPSAFDDLWSAGALGLLEAAPRFDPARGVSFETFVAHRVRGAMLDELRRLDHLPRRLRSRTDDLQKAKRRLSAELGREAEPEELARELDMDVEAVDDIAALAEAPVPLESVLPTLGAELRFDEDLDRARVVSALAGAIRELPERLQVLVSLHYVEGLSYREIAKIFDVSEPRVCQLHGDALKRLRAAVGRLLPERPGEKAT